MLLLKSLGFLQNYAIIKVAYNLGFNLDKVSELMIITKMISKSKR